MAHQLDYLKVLSRFSRDHVPFGPVVWIVLLLAFWLVIADWHELPDAISNTMAHLPG